MSVLHSPFPTATTRLPHAYTPPILFFLAGSTSLRGYFFPSPWSPHLGILHLPTLCLQSYYSTLPSLPDVLAEAFQHAEQSKGLPKTVAHPPKQA